MVELDEVEEVLQDRIRLVLRHADNPLRKVWVYEHGLPARDGIRPVISLLVTIFQPFQYHPVGRVADEKAPGLGQQGEKRTE